MNGDFADWMQRDLVAGITPANLGLAIGAALAVYFVLTLALRFAIAQARRLAGRTENQVDNMLADVLGGTNRWLIALAAVLVGVGMLDLPERWSARVDQLWFIALALQFALWLNRAVTLGVRRYHARHDSAGTPQVGASGTLMSWALRTVLWAVVLLAVLSNLGVDITAFIASMGIGGIAVALAVQTILSDLFASLSIAVDKPFEVGHFIIFGDVLGTVTYVGLKTTRIQALSGQQIVISNAELLKQTINNYKFMSQRRVVFGFGVSHATTPDQAEAIPALVRRAIESQDKTRFDRAHLLKFDENALQYEVVYYILDGDYNVYMDRQQAINLTLMRGLSEMGVSFAWPRRAVQMLDAPTQAHPWAAPVQAALQPAPSTRQ